MPAVRYIPQELFHLFTLNGQIRVADFYIDDTEGVACDYSRFYRPDAIDSMIEKAKRGEVVQYVNTDLWLYEALRQYPIGGLRVAIIGSEKPSYESICIAYRGKPITIEYKKLYSEHPGLTLLTVYDYESSPNPEIFDAAFSISSYEHDGLGRYGDPIDPYGDLKSMKKLKNMVKKGGLLYLAVPVGVDTLFWNATRQYGNLRFPMLIEGWEFVDSFGFERMDMIKEYGTYKVEYKGEEQIRWNFHQPVFVLRNK